MERRSVVVDVLFIKGPAILATSSVPLSSASAVLNGVRSAYAIREAEEKVVYARFMCERASFSASILITEVNAVVNKGGWRDQNCMLIKSILEGESLLWSNWSMSFQVSYLFPIQEWIKIQRNNPATFV